MGGKLNDVRVSHVCGYINGYICRLWLCLCVCCRNDGRCTVTFCSMAMFTKKEKNDGSLVAAKCPDKIYLLFGEYRKIQLTVSAPHLSRTTDLKSDKGKINSFNTTLCREIFKYHQFRLSSFHVKHNCLFKNMPCVELALTGFYHTLIHGDIQCFSCDFRINILQENIDPLTLHKTRSRNCLHLKGLDKRNVPFGMFNPRDTISEGGVTSSGQEFLSTNYGGNSTDQSDSGIGDDRYSSRDTISDVETNLSSHRSSDRSNHPDERLDDRSLLRSAPLMRDLPRNPAAEFRSFPSTNNARQQLGTRTQVPDRRRRNLNRRVPIPDNRYELCRLQSFRTWPNNAAADPEELANAGFTYLGFDDRVQCYVCQGKLRCWEPQDRPLAEHMRHFPNCRYLAGPQSVGNVPLGEEDEALFQTVLMRQGTSEASYNEAPDLVAKGIISNRPIHADKVQMAQRSATFRDFPSNVYHKPEDFFKAGFFYTGMVDEVCCYFCNITIRNWKPSDDVWIQHAIRSPKCGFLTMSKGETFINKAKTEKKRLRRRRRAKKSQGETLHKVSDNQVREVMSSRIVLSVIDMGFDATVVKKVVVKRLKQMGQAFPNTESLIDSVNEFEEDPSDTSDSEDESEDKSAVAANVSVLSSLKELKIKEDSVTSNEDVGTLEASNQQLRDETRCKVCLDEDACIVFLKCGHLVCCSECAPELTKCPVCRQNILGTIRVDKNLPN